MEEILSNTLVPDNEVVKRATEQLKEEMKKETAIPQLCNIMTTSSRIEVRTLLDNSIASRIKYNLSFTSRFARVLQCFFVRSWEKLRSGRPYPKRRGHFSGRDASKLSWSNLIKLLAMQLHDWLPHWLEIR
jgi:hypothetical protein